MAPTPSPDLPRHPRRSLRVLVAEDNLINQRLVQAYLEQRGHTPVMAADGHEAVARLEREAFDVVLMDLEMGGMNGFEATAAIRARERATGTHVPIVAITAHAEPEDRRRCLAAGMDDFLTKPIRYDQLIAALEGSLPSSSERLAPGVPDPGREFSALFVADAARLGAVIEDAFARRDEAALALGAHQLRGSAGYFAAERTWELAKLLEDLGRAGDFSARTAEACAELARELARLGRDVPHS